MLGSAAVLMARGLGLLAPSVRQRPHRAAVVPGPDGIQMDVLLQMPSHMRVKLRNNVENESLTGALATARMTSLPYHSQECASYRRMHASDLGACGRGRRGALGFHTY